MNNLKDEAYCSICGKHKQFLGRPICLRCEPLPKNEIPLGNPGYGQNEILVAIGKFFDATSFMDQEFREHLCESYCEICDKITNQYRDVSLTGSLYPDNVKKIRYHCYSCDKVVSRYYYPDGTEFNFGR